MTALLLFLVRDAYARFGWRLPALLALMVLGGLLEGLAITIALPLLGALAGSANPSAFVAFMSSLPARLGLPEGPAGIGMLMVALVVAGALAFLAQARLATRLQTSYVEIWQRRLFEAAMGADLAWLGGRRGGDVVNGVVGEANRVAGSFYHACIVATALVNLVVYLGLALLVSPLVSVAVILLGGALLVATRPFVRRAYGFGEAITAASADIQSIAGEATAAAKLVKAAVAEDAAGARFADATRRLADAQFRNGFDIQKAKAVFEFGGAAGVAILLVAGPLLFAVDVATVIIVLALFVRLLPRITAVQQGVQALAAMLPALANLREQVAAAKAAAEPADPRSLPPDLAGRAPQIMMRGVDVVRGERRVLTGIDLVVRAGRIVAVVGPSGSGKSTLVDAMLGLVAPSAGVIRIDGHDLAELPRRAWRRAVGYVGQDTVLLAGTVADNVRLGNDADDATIADALARASAGFVGVLAAGADSAVGDRGAKLSGGERQRIGLARALAIPRMLYVLDEATSALDAETEADVVATVAALAPAATVVIVAHRFSAIRRADDIHVLEEGRIVESGSWSDLDRPGTRFRALRDLQQAPPTRAVA